MRAQNLPNSKQIGNHKNQGSNLLLQLENKVNNKLNQSLKLENSEKGVNGDMTAGKINPQEVRNYIAEISQGTLPGMLIQNAVI